MSRAILQSVCGPTICAPMLRPQVPVSKMSAFSNLELVNSGLSCDDDKLTIDIFVGLDQYWHFVKCGLCHGDKGLWKQCLGGWYQDPGILLAKHVYVKFLCFVYT